METSSAADHDDVNQQILEDNDDPEINETATFLLQPVGSADAEDPSINMSGEEKRKKHSAGPTSEPTSAFFQHMTTGAHACILLFVILIVYYCFSGEFVFFTWHPLFMAVGWGFLMTEAILTISKDNLFTGTAPKKLRVRLHWIFQVVAGILILIAFVVIYVNKNNLNKEHFKSWHGLFGFIGIVAVIPTLLNGVLALYHGPLRNYIKPRTNKFIHISNGIIAFGFGGMALILSVYTKWFARNSNENVLIFIVGLGLVTTAVVWTLMRPFITATNQLKSMFVTAPHQS